MWLSDMQKYGVGLTAAGVFFFALGLITFFDSALLAFGNVLFLSGILLIIGLRRTFSFFFSRPSKIRGSVFFFLGIILILMKYSFVGFAIECFGILALFGDFFGVIVTFLRSLPVIGPLLSSPYIAPVLDRIAGLNVLPV